jgi:hypothetical protein
LGVGANVKAPDFFSVSAPELTGLTRTALSTDPDAFARTPELAGTVNVWLATTV